MSNEWHQIEAAVAPSLDDDRFFSASALEGLPVTPRHWLVDGIVPNGTVTLLSGDGGTGKSLVALQLAAAVATGGKWLGRTVSGGGALYLSAEDDRDELHRRILAIAAADGVTLAELDRLTLASFAGDDALLARLNPDGTLTPTGLLKALETRVRRTRPALLVLDTLADLFPGNENDRAQARQFVGMLRGIAIRHECAVVMLAHPSLSGMTSGSGTSGSTGWNNSVRSRLYLERVKDGAYEANPDARVLRTMKANYGPVGGEIGLTYRDGVFVADPAETALDRMSGNAKAERVFLSLLREVNAQGRRVNHAGGNNYAPNVFAAHPKSEGITKSVFKSAMEILLSNGRIRIAQDGRPSKVRQFLEVAE